MKTYTPRTSPARPWEFFHCEAFRSELNRTLETICEDLDAAGCECIRKAPGACYFRLPDGDTVRVADHSPMHVRSYASIMLNPKPVL